MRQTKAEETDRNEVRLHTDICNVPTHLLPDVRMQIKLTKARRELYLLSKDADSIVVFTLLEAQLMAKRVRPNYAYLVAHNTALQAGALARFNLTIRYVREGNAKQQDGKMKHCTVM